MTAATSGWPLSCGENGPHSRTPFAREKFHASDGFRRDLFFRISGLFLTIPALRERPKDLALLVATEIARAARKQGNSIVGLDRAAADRLFSLLMAGEPARAEQMNRDTTFADSKRAVAQRNS
jgi:transcriptional regulator with PAS, ATPase and Fis domain